MRRRRLHQQVQLNLSGLLDTCNIIKNKLNDENLLFLNKIEDELVEFLITAQKQMEFGNWKQKMGLGEIFTVSIEKKDPTEDFFALLTCKDAYDTLKFADFMGLMHTVKSEEFGNFSRDARVSLYIKRKVDAGKECINTYRSIKQLKQSFCDRIFIVYKNAEDDFLNAVFTPFMQDRYDKDGDFFFKSPLKFRADHGRASLSDFYIVGVNYDITDYFKSEGQDSLCHC